MKIFPGAGGTDMFETAYGYAIPPTIGKGGVVVGATNVSGQTGGSSATASGGNNATATSPGYHKGMATYTITKGGAMVEASVSGQYFNFTKLAE